MRAEWVNRFRRGGREWSIVDEIIVEEEEACVSGRSKGGRGWKQGQRRGN